MGTINMAAILSIGPMAAPNLGKWYMQLVERYLGLAEGPTTDPVGLHGRGGSLEVRTIIPSLMLTHRIRPKTHPPQAEKRSANYVIKDIKTIGYR